MSRTPKKPPLALDMDFGEALRRFGQTKYDDLPDNAKLKKRAQKAPSNSSKPSD